MWVAQTLLHAGPGFDKGKSQLEYIHPSRKGRHPAGFPGVSVTCIDSETLLANGQHRPRGLDDLVWCVHLTSRLAIYLRLSIDVSGVWFSFILCFFPLERRRYRLGHGIEIILLLMSSCQIFGKADEEGDCRRRKEGAG